MNKFRIIEEIRENGVSFFIPQEFVLFMWIDFTNKGHRLFFLTKDEADNFISGKKITKRIIHD